MPRRSFKLRCCLVGGTGGVVCPVEPGVPIDGTDPLGRAERGGAGVDGGTVGGNDLCPGCPVRPEAGVC